MYSLENAGLTGVLYGRAPVWTIVLFLALRGVSAPSVATEVRTPERVTLQLKWTHAFQFAGYYAALEKGFYREAGIDVNIVEATPGVDPIRRVIEGQAQFGVGTSSLLLERNAGKPVVALAVIFQHSPYVLIARHENAVQGIHDLIGKRIMLEPQSEELLAYLKIEGIPRNRLTLVKHSYDPQDLIDGKVDAIAGYVINQPYYLDRAHFQYQIFSPRSAGIDFYGDNLFTTEKELRGHPATVKAFRAASLRGWQYAMEHPEEVVDVILAQYSQRHTRDYHLFEARQMMSLLRPELIEIGYMNPGRWRHIAETYAELGMINPDFKLKGFLYDANPPPLDLGWLYLFLGAATLAIALVSSLTLYIYRINVRLRRNISDRKLAEAALKSSEERFRDLLQSVPAVAVQGYGLDGITTYWNRASEQLYGYTAQEAIGRNLLDLIIPPEMREDVGRAIRQMSDTGQPIPSAELTLKRKDGSRVAVHSSHSIVRIIGRPAEFFCLDIDITERKRMEEALCASEERFRKLFAEMPFGCALHEIVCDETGKPADYVTLEINDAFEKLLGARRVEVVGKRASALLPPAEFSKWMEIFGSVGITGKSVHYEMYSAFNHKYFEGSAYCTEPGKFAGTFMDVTERKHAEAELQKMQKLESVGTLAGGIAHDFNNILMGLFGNISLAKAELAIDHPGFIVLEDAEKSMSRAVRLTGQLLTFAKGGDPITENVRLGTLVEEVARFDLSGSNTKLVFRQVDDLMLVGADKGQIQQVISNLIINARQAMPDGGSLYITLENADLPEWAIPGLRQGKYVKIALRDEGTGIDPKHLDRIFDPYFTTKQTGNGLGLATAYSIIKKHGGQIAVVSELGKGTTFSIYLPAFKSGHPEETRQSAVEDRRPARRASILVMDDDKSVCAVVVKMLTRCGFSVATALGGKEAIAMYEQAQKAGTSYDAVIMDLTIPGGMGGRETIKRLLTIDPKARAIVSSGYADDPVMANFTEYGFKGVAVKPYTQNELLGVLGLVLKS